MIPEQTEAIIFDFGGVIINIDYNFTIEAFKSLGVEDFESMYSQAQQSDLFDAIETGRISAQSFINGLLDYLPSGTSPNSVVTAWNAMILDVPSERIELLQKLRQHYQVYLLSNTNEIHIEKALGEWTKANSFGIESCFDSIYLSHEMGMRKPNKEIFERVCNEQNLYPSKTLFIDDSIQHIEGAKNAGLQSIFLTDGMEIQSIFS